MATGIVQDRQEEGQRALRAAQAAVLPESSRRFALDEQTGHIVDLGTRLLWTVVLDYEYDSYDVETKEARFSDSADAGAFAFDMVAIALSPTYNARLTITIEPPADLPQFMSRKLTVEGGLFKRGRQYFDEWVNSRTCLDDSYERDIELAMATKQ